MQAKQKLCYLQGVGLEYIDYCGKQVTVEQEVRDQLLLACGHDLSDESLAKTNEELDAFPWFQLVADVQATLESNAQAKLRFSSSSLLETFYWKIFNEDGELMLQGECEPNTLKEVGDYYYDNLRFSERCLPLSTLSLGYYRLEVEQGDKSAHGRIICAPKQCFNNISGRKLWGVSVQLYSIKSSGNYIIGDFSDLKELIELSANQGADYILLNPLHKLFPQCPERASPYSPSDRTQLNPLYLCCELSEDFCHQKQRNTIEASKLVKSGYINYRAVSREKTIAFKQLFSSFESNELKINSIRAQSFLMFKNIHQHWQLSDYELYLQWQCSLQLEQCQNLCKKLSMKIGLMLDLAVGCAPDGEEYQRNKALYADNTSVGAPPDLVAANGQNWGLPAIDPIKLKADNYNYFIELVQQNMKNCGGLRIDHVMGLMRLWWCVQYKDKPHGCYVYYPLKEMLAILALESQRNQCLIVGEDLGVVPAEMHQIMAQADIFANDIFYFEKHDNGQFKSLADFRDRAMLMVANHDVAPFSAWWQGKDIELKFEFGLYDSETQLSAEMALREQDKQALLVWLGGKYRLTQYGSQQTTYSISNVVTTKVYLALVSELALSPAQLLCLQVDDLEGNDIPVNIPGTDVEYPNWRRRLSQSLNETFKQNDLFEAINQGRKYAEQQAMP